MDRIALLFLFFGVMPLFSQAYHGNILVAEQATQSFMILKTDGDWSKPESILWQWEARTVPEIQEKGLFHNPSDMKLAANGRQLLLTCSGGGVALVDIATKSVLFQAAPRGNPHASLLLSDGSVISASSSGNYLTLFTRKNNGAIPYKTLTLPLPDAHGVVWDGKRQLIWAIGLRHLVAYRYNFNSEEPQLIEVYRQKPFEEDTPFCGHDLVKLSDDRLLLTGGYGILEYDMATRKFKVIAKMPFVKSVSLDEKTKMLIYVKSTQSWWTDTVLDLNSERKWYRPGAKFYKARWFR